MASVHCLDCGSSVVVDPNGICPEGHVVGNAGARIERGMGTASPHPDEPEPWVATVVLDETEAGPAIRQRSARPLRALGSDVEERPSAPVDHDAMLRELHELGAFSGSDDLSALAAPATAPVRPTSNVPAPDPDHDRAGGRDRGADAPTAPAVPLPTRDEMADGFAELSALEAAVQALGHDEPSPAPSADRDHGATSDLSALEDLFGGTAAPAPAAPSMGHPDVTAAPSAPSPSPAATTPPPAPTAPTASPASTASPAPPAPGAAVPATDASGDPDAHVPEPPAAPPEQPSAGLDITNFTARGSKVGAGRGGRRKRFGR